MADNVTINIVEEVTDVTINVSQIGEQGTPGTNGIGIPTGGTTGQLLKKSSNADYAVEWGNGTSTGVNTYIQDTDPAPAGVNYAWWQTSGGNLVTLWINII